MSFKFFSNTECEFYPCHKADDLNCLFCYCPLYPFKDCGGNFTYIDVTEENGSAKQIKDCSNCLFPHIKENYDKVILKLKNFRSL